MKGLSLYLELLTRLSERVASVVKAEFGVDIEPPMMDTPPNLELGDLSCASCFELAKKLRQPPRKIAEVLAAKLLPIDGIMRATNRLMSGSIFVVAEVL